MLEQHHENQVRSQPLTFTTSAVIYLVAQPVAVQMRSPSHIGQHPPQEDTQLNTDKASLVDLSQLVSLARFAKYSLSVHVCPSLSSPSLYLDLPPWVHIVLLSDSHSSPSHQSLCLFAPWEEEEEDVASCCARGLLLWSSCMRVRALAWGAWKWQREQNAITEQVSVNLCWSQFTLSSLFLYLSHTFTHLHIYTKTFAAGQHDITVWKWENSKKMCQGEGKGHRAEGRGAILKRTKKRQAGEQSDKGQKEEDKKRCYTEEK